MNEKLEHQIRMNRTTWKVLVENGFKSGSPASVDFFYHAQNRAAAEAICAALCSAGTQATTYSRGWLWFRQWSVTGSSQEPSITLERLDAWVTEMVELGARHSCDFDGWGMAI